MNPAEKPNFGGLNEIRALAALGVLFHHVELYKYRNHFQGLYDTPLKPFIYGLGKNSVYIFFVLSGFLITSLLLYEKNKFGKINFFSFYMRRVLRIWPLYFIIVIIGFVVVPIISQSSLFSYEVAYGSLIERLSEDYVLVLILFLFFLPNVALKYFSPVVGSAHAWSVGFEEQFYLIWPALIQYLTRFFFLGILFLLIFLYPFLPQIADALNLSGMHKNLSLITEVFPFHFMAIGALTAYMWYYYKSKLSFVFANRYLSIPIIVALIVYVVYNPTYPSMFENPHLPIIFGLLIGLFILFTIQKDAFFRSKLLDSIGVISYGLYMYHPFVMFVCFACMNNLFSLHENPVLFNCLIYGAVISATYAISKFSYLKVERKFLNLKDKKFSR